MGSPRLGWILAATMSILVVGCVSTPIERRVVRAGGQYRVARIDPLGKGSFRVEFHSLKPTGRFDVLVLETDHVHVSVVLGQELRLTSSVVEESGSQAEVAQVLVFVNSPQGGTPVWLLSRRHVSADLDAARYLEMHNPASDYVVL